MQSDANTNPPGQAHHVGDAGGERCLVGRGFWTGFPVSGEGKWGQVVPRRERLEAPSLNIFLVQSDRT